MHKNAELIVDNSESQSVVPARNGSSSTTAKTDTRRDNNHTRNVSQNDTAFVSRDQRLPSEPEAIGTVLKRGRGRPPKQPYDEHRDHIFAYVNDFARELGDNAPLKSSVTRAYNIYRASGASIERFTDAMYQARGKTLERSASIRTQRTDGEVWSPKAKMSYWFAVLEHELGSDRAEQTAFAT